MAGSRQDSVGSRWQVARQRSEKATHYKCTISIFSANSVMVSNLPFVTKLRIQPTETKVVPVFMLKVLPKVSVSQGSCCRLVTSSEDPKQWWLSNQTMTHRWLTFIFKTQSFCFKELRRLDLFCKFQFQLMIYNPEAIPRDMKRFNVTRQQPQPLCPKWCNLAKWKGFDGFQQSVDQCRTVQKRQMHINHVLKKAKHLVAKHCNMMNWPRSFQKKSPRIFGDEFPHTFITILLCLAWGL